MTPNRPQSKGYNRRNSVLYTQGDVLYLQAQKGQLEARLREVEAKLEKAIEIHREQIKRSLTAFDEEERRMARSIATFWEVPLPDKE